MAIYWMKLVVELVATLKKREGIPQSKPRVWHSPHTTYVLSLADWGLPQAAAEDRHELAMHLVLLNFCRDCGPLHARLHWPSYKVLSLHP